ncbi:MAG: ABC transporter ATP-binding protein [Gemmatimonadota bacterium]|nr:ABC transporter ATP-binding protein [Gemmatimonadota bacterium]
MENKAVLVKGLSKDYTIGSTTSRVLKDVTFSVERGEFLILMGPSGSGKSTLLYMIGGLAHPTTGRIWLGGSEMTGRNDSGITKLRHDKIGFVFQRFNLLPTLSALDNVSIALRLTLFPNGNGKIGPAHPERLLEMVGLGDKMHHKPKELSIGEQQRVAIARALVRNPEILLADEPTGSLDRDNSDNILEILNRLHREHSQTIVMVTHDPAVSKQGDRVLHLVDGQIELEGMGNNA